MIQGKDVMRLKKNKLEYNRKKENQN